jgi:hypothetical protein
VSESLLLDPVIARTCGALISIVLLTSAWQKLRDIGLFRIILENYRLLPDALVAPAALALPLLEVAAGAMLLFADLRAGGGLLALTVLAGVSAGVAINLVRGRLDLDCGCGGVSGSQPISWGLVLRNLVLMALTLIGMQEGAARALVWVDYLSVGAGTLALLGLYACANQLLANHPRLSAMRHRHG